MRQFPMRSAKPKNLQLNLFQIKAGLGSKWISDQSSCAKAVIFL